MMKAKYTMYLHTIMNDSEGRRALDKALSTYPMYTPKNESFYSIIPSREEMNQKILDHYEFHEIGFESVGRFLKELKHTMEEIMPYYYSMFKSADIMNALEDPFGNVDITETFKQETSSRTSNESNHSENGSTSGNDQTNSKGRNVKSDTPQSEISIGSIDDVHHASQVEWNENQNESSNGSTSDLSSQDESSGTTAGTTQHTFTKKGNQGVNTYAHDMVELRTVFVNIEQMILNDERLQELFMMVY